MAEQVDSGSGFILPQPGGATAPATPAPTPATGAPSITLQAPGVATDTSSRDLLIGGGILVVLLIAFFFVRGGYANMLVRRRVSPSKANAAGWWLFVLLSSLATLAVFAAVHPARFLTPLVAGPLCVIALAGLVLTLISSRR